MTKPRRKRDVPEIPNRENRTVRGTRKELENRGYTSGPDLRGGWIDDVWSDDVSANFSPKALEGIHRGSETVAERVAALLPPIQPPPPLRPPESFLETLRRMRQKMAEQGTVQPNTQNAVSNKCNICGEECGTYPVLEIHMLQKHSMQSLKYGGNMVVTAPAVVPFAGNAELQPCAICNKLLGTNTAMQVHMAEHMEESAQRILKTAEADRKAENKEPTHVLLVITLRQTDSLAGIAGETRERTATVRIGRREGWKRSDWLKFAEEEGTKRLIERGEFTEGVPVSVVYFSAELDETL